MREREITKIIIHCSATKPSMDIGAAEIRDWHVRGNGWHDIGYHGVIRRDGRLESGRNMAVPGAHCYGHNAASIGICLVGGLGEDGTTAEANFTPEQWESLARLVRDLTRKFPDAGVHGHNEFAAKACPCFAVGAWWEGIKAQSAGGDAIEGRA